MLAGFLWSNFDVIFESGSRDDFFHAQYIADVSGAAYRLAAQPEIMLVRPSHHVHRHDLAAESHAHAVTIELAGASGIGHEAAGPLPEVGRGVARGQRDEDFRRAPRCAGGGLANPDVGALESHEEAGGFGADRLRIE